MRHSSLLVCLLLLFISCSFQVFGKVDRELKTCQHQCRAQQQADEGLIRSCLRDCEDYSLQKQRREEQLRRGGRSGQGQEDERRRREEEHRGGGRYPGQEDERRREEEHRRGGRSGQEERREEEHRRGGSSGRWPGQEEEGPQHGRQEGSEEEHRRGGSSGRWPGQEEEGPQHGRQEGSEEEHRRGGSSGRWPGQEEEGRQHGRQEGNNPYVFQDEHFTSRFETEHGRVRVLQRFSDRSELLQGIDNYRLTILEAEPQAFIIPNHLDADAVFFVVKGKGTISLIRADSEKRESLNVKKGDILKIPAGTPLYLINRDNNEKLIVAKLMKPVSTPGHFESFFGVGGENPESFYTTFSNEILEAAFNTNRENLERLFGGERKEEGVILKASQDQIKALSQHEQGGVWPFQGGESKGTVNIFKQSPSHSNQYGQLYEVSANELRGLEDINVQVSFLNLTKNAMMGPTYTSKATKISLVVDGEGYFEMACPHLSSQSEGRQRQRGQRGGRSSQRRGSRGSETSYQQVNTRLTRGTVVVIPAGHPYVAVASNNQNLEMVCFEVNARNSWRYALAGKGNVVNKFEKEAKELAFGVSSEEVDEVFGSQDEEVFFPGPRHQEHQECKEHRQHEGRAEE